MLNFTLKGLKKVDYDIKENCLLFVFKDGTVEKVSNAVKGYDSVYEKVFGVKRV